MLYSRKMTKFAFKYLSFMVLALGLCLFLFYGSRTARSVEKENHCFTCHTSARKLIQITREISKANKGEPEASAETEGEG